MIGILTPLFLEINPNTFIQEFRIWESEQNRTPIESTINSTLEDYDYGENDTTIPPFMLQLSCDESEEGSGWRYYRCGYRFGIRPSEDGESEDCWSRHTREENEGLGGEGTWIRCDQLDEGKVKRDDQGR